MTETKTVADGQTTSPVLTVDEAAVYLRISRGLAFAAVADGTLPSVRIGRRILVPRRQLEALLDGQQHPGDVAPARAPAAADRRDGCWCPAAGPACPSAPRG